jgi:uncharacterized protein YndB with AHSA1/START domain
MSGRSVIHDTFRIEQTYAAAPATVFAAFSTEEARSSWGETAEVEPLSGEDGGDSEASEFDFRVGGRERFSVKVDGATYRYDGRYYDIVPDNRIVYCYEMYAGDTRISVSVATIEFAASSAGTQLAWTEQGIYLDGYNGAEAPAMRETGTIDMLNGLASYLRRQDATPEGRQDDGR